MYSIKLTKQLFVCIWLCILVMACGNFGNQTLRQNKSSGNECEMLVNPKEIESYLVNGVAKLSQDDYLNAIVQFDEGIRFLGKHYSKNSLLDDTGKKLALAEIEEHNGNLGVAANLKMSVLESRYIIYKADSHCSS